MVNPVIGIISYLPDDPQVRELRFKKLCKLIDTCNSLFSLPIYIVIQRYGEKEIQYLSRYKNVTVSDNYDKLGIVGARKALRSWFIGSKYNCLVMLDDDCDINGTKEGGARYLKTLHEFESGFGEFRGSQLKLFSITKDLIKEVDFDDSISPEEGIGFEDTIFVGRLRTMFPKKKFTYEHYQLYEKSLGARDSLSTWYKNQDLKKMLDYTHKVRDNKL